jgi:hypothetical protein
MNEIKIDLLHEYNKYYKEYGDKIIDILISEGKSNSGHKVKSEAVSFSHIILDENYYLTTFDIWLLILKYKIPTIFISSFGILQTNHRIFIAYGEKQDDKFAFIRLPATRNKITPIFSIIEDNDNNCFISINNIHEKCMHHITSAFTNKTNINTFLDNYSKKTHNKPSQFNINNEDEQIDSNEEIDRLETSQNVDISNTDTNTNSNTQLPITKSVRKKTNINKKLIIH